MNCIRCLCAVMLSLMIAGQAHAVSIKNVTFQTKHAGSVVFNHAGHLAEKGMEHNCRACHDALYDLKKKKHFTMSDMARGKSCGACHNGNTAFHLKECARCHQVKEIVYKVKETGPTRFSHKSHLDGSPDCAVCHPSLFAAGRNRHVTMADMEKGKSCGACHNGTKAFGVQACVSCHPVKDITYEIAETGSTRFSHTRHIEVAGCGQCHPKLYAPNGRNTRVGMAAMQKGKSCGACHNGRKAFGIDGCVSCHPVKDLVFEDKTLGNAVFRHAGHARLYSCTDCHRSLYRTSRSGVKVTMRQMEEGASCGHCHDGKSAFSVKDRCGTCHKI